MSKYLSDISFSSNDYALNSLLTLLPKKIYIHLIDNVIDEFIHTLGLIFEDRAQICTDCNICRLYKNSKIKKNKGEKMSAKLIFSDIDGTLINDELKVTPKTRDAIRRQIIKGNIFIPTSARLPKGMMTVVRQILKVCPMIAYNGALALDETGRALITR